MREANLQRLIFLICAFMSVADAQSAPPRKAPPRKDIPAIAKAANGSVVSIVMSDKDGKPIAQGSGFVVGKDGLIVTNYHVIAQGSSAVVKLPDGAFYVVDGALACDKTRDIAVVKAHGQNFKMLTLGDSDRVQVGETVVAIGNPLSLESTVSSGIVSAIRTIKEEGGKVLQITAPISPGSSGGPLFNMAGEVVGITTAGLKGGENLNFAIPINDAKHLVASSKDEWTAVLDFPNERQEVRPEETHTKSTLSEQKACSEQAAQKLKEWMSEDKFYQPTLDNYGQTSHYDSSQGICYVRMSLWRHEKINGQVQDIFHNYTIKDAFGGAIVGTFISVKPPFCKINPPNQPMYFCKSEEEFDDLARKYFGFPN